MAAVGTQAIDAEYEEEEAADLVFTPPDCYGRLFSLRDHFGNIDLKEDKTLVVGRNVSCDYVLQGGTNDVHVPTYSQKHFEIKRSKAEDGSFFTVLKDLSSNGTFVNGDKIGRNKSRVLTNSDQISLSMAQNKAWSYVEFAAITQKLFPACVTEHYTVSKTLGSGAFGEVRLVFETGSCKRYAMKIVSKKTLTLPSAMSPSESIKREVSILQSLSHPNIVRIERFIDSDDRVFIILELAEGGELFDRIVEQPSRSGFDSATAKFLCYQMAQAVKYLHDNGITHRDLKPENFLLKDSSQQNKTLVKLADFGVSKLVSSETMLRTFCGTQCYLAPEVMQSDGSSPYTNKVDVWSLGVIFFICLAGYPPFTDERKDRDLQAQICGGHVNFPREHWSHVDAEAIDLVKKMLVVKVDKRFSMRQVCEHQWFRDDQMKTELRSLLDREGQKQQQQDDEEPQQQQQVPQRHYLADWVPGQHDVPEVCSARPIVGGSGGGGGRKRQSQAPLTDEQQQQAKRMSVL